MAITLRAVTGSALSHNQLDTNFSSLFYSASISASVLSLHYTGSAAIGQPPTSSSIVVPNSSKWTDTTGGGISRNSTVQITGSTSISGSTNIIGNLTQGFSGLQAYNFSHAEGYITIASGAYSHAEGYLTATSGNYSHAEGRETSTAILGQYSHAEGYLAVASGSYSHAEGQSTVARGLASHAEGLGTVALGNYQHVQGQYNLSSSVQSAFIIGNGVSDGSRSNLVFAAGNTVQVTGSLNVSGAITGSLFGTASSAATASFAPNYLPLTGGTINGNVAINGTASIAFLNVTIESASVIYSSGSNQFGDATNDTQTLIGTVLVSGSQRITGSLNVTQGITGSLFGTATNSVSSSYPFAVTGSSLYTTIGSAPSGLNANGVIAIGGGGGLSIGTNSSIFIGNAFTGYQAPYSFDSVFMGTAAGQSAISASDSVFIGWAAGQNTVNAQYSNFFGNRAGRSTSASFSNFFGQEAGANATNATYSNFIGRYAGAGATNANRSSFIGPFAGEGATAASYSNFIGDLAGRFATAANNSNFIGPSAGLNATTANNSNFLGGNAGNAAVSASYSNLLGYNVGYNIGSLSIGSNNIIIGTNITLAAQQKNSINLGGIIFATGSYSTTGGNPFSGSVTGARVGIGTNNPQFTLDISGSVNITNDLYLGGIKQFNHGMFYHTASQTVANGTSGSTLLSTTSVANGVSIVSGSRITMANTGYYNIQFSAQLAQGANTANYYLWFKKNGINIDNSMSKKTLSNNTNQIMTVDIIDYAANAGDYYEIVHQSDAANSTLEYIAASGNYPAGPPIIVTVQQVR